MSRKSIGYHGISFLLVLFFLMPSLFLSPAQAVSERILPGAAEVPLPQSLTLCGEPIPLHDFRVREMLDREITIAAWDQAQVFMWFKRAGRYFPFIEKKLKEESMPQDLKYLAVAESSLLNASRSHKGAVGIWQFMPQTAELHGLRSDPAMDQRRDFESATTAALRYLKFLKQKFGSWNLAMAAYNCGDNHLKEEMEIQKVSNYYRLDLPVETERYIFRIAAAKTIMENPKVYGYIPDPDRIYRLLEYETVMVQVPTPIHITEVAHTLGTDFKNIKELNPHIRGYDLPAGSYPMKVPPGKGPQLSSLLKQVSTILPRQEKKVAAQGAQSYVVRNGDTLIHIAQRTGVPVDKLKRLNGISGSLISVGQRLRLTP